MKTPLALQHSLLKFVDRQHARLVEIARELIRIPSENCPPYGAEKACQDWIAAHLQSRGIETVLYRLEDIPGLREHALYHAGRDYTDRPNLAARRSGVGGGRSLLLAGHIDTVPSGSLPWSRDCFGGQIEGNRLYGRGSNDMKAGVATNLFVMESLAELGISLAGDLLFETVVDEEFGGCNGTLAGRLRGFNADAVVLSEPTSLRVCPAQRGGRTVHITFHAPGGVLRSGRFPAGVIPQLTFFLNRLPDFAAQRQTRAPIHEMYANHADPVPVSVTKIVTAPWGFGEPMTVPETAQVELYWQCMPGETQVEVEREFFLWLAELVDASAEIFPTMPEVTMPIRWLPGSSIHRDAPVVQTLAACAAAVTCEETTVAGIEGPCDLFVFQQGFDIPAVLWGPRGGNTHGADEYVEIDSLITAAKSLLLFVVEWCGLGAQSKCALCDP